MELYYINSKNQKLDLMKPPYLIRDITELLDYDWRYRIDGNRISGFDKEISEIPLVLNIIGDTEREYVDACNHFFEVVETDIINNVKGKLYYGENYILCNIVGNVKKDWFYNIGYELDYIRIVTDHPYWCRDRTFRFYKNTEAILDAENREGISEIIQNSEIEQDYPYDYDYDFMSRYRLAKRNLLYDYPNDYYKNHTVGILDNDHFTESDFIMTVYGPCTQPEIWIGDKLYRVKAVLYDGEYMVIDSAARTLFRYARNGVQENLYHMRDNQYSVFERISPGKHTVKWNAQYSFDVKLRQERSEPLRT